MDPFVICQNGGDSRSGQEWILFQDFKRVISSDSAKDLSAILSEVELERSRGNRAAGFVAYDASSGADPKMKTRDGSDTPLIWFAIFGTHTCSAERPSPPDSVMSDVTPNWTPRVDEAEFLERTATIKDHIQAGDCYQINFTFPLTAQTKGSPFDLFRKMADAQRCRYGAYIETDDFAICSSSPELFFQQEQGTIRSKPMKGTARRGQYWQDDCERAQQLQTSSKERAENVMIVDMIRNDMGRIAKPGTVTVTNPFDIERYPTVLQMTSTVSCRSDASLADVFRAMFPCASITGAPKIKAMEIIEQLEGDARGLYTGSIGYALPEGESCFNVAIRTAVVDKRDGLARYHVGSGIIWDSEPAAEYQECLIKAKVLSAPNPSFDLLETMLFEPEQGVFLLDRHLDRLGDSARFFGWPFSGIDIRTAIQQSTESLTDLTRVRLTLCQKGVLSLAVSPEPSSPAKDSCTLELHPQRIDTQTPFFYNKTTHRSSYSDLQAAHPEADDVIMQNLDGYLTEATMGNIVLELDSQYLTPARRHGLLAGVFRADLLEKGEIEEADLTEADLVRADRIFLINSVRKWVPAVLSSFSS